MTSALPSFGRVAAAWLPRALAYAGVLGIVAEGTSANGLFIVLVAALVAELDAAASRWQAWTVRPLALARFAGFFIAHSVRAGANVAWRAVHPRLPIAPGMARFALRLPDPGSRVLFANVASLLPGTLAVELDADTLHLHLLDVAMPVEPSLRTLERRIAALRGVALDAAGSPP